MSRLTYCPKCGVGGTVYDATDDDGEPNAPRACPSCAAAKVCGLCAQTIGGKPILIAREPKEYGCSPCVRRVSA